MSKTILISQTIRNFIDDIDSMLTERSLHDGLRLYETQLGRLFERLCRNWKTVRMKDLILQNENAVGP